MIKVILGATIKLRDQFTVTMAKVAKETSAFRKEVEEAKKQIREMRDAKVQARLKVAEDTVSPRLEAIKKRLEPLRKKLVTVVAIKETVTDDVRRITTRLHILGRLTVRPVVAITDRATKVINAIRGRLTSLPGLISGVAAGIGVGKAVDLATTNEMQMVTMAAVLKSKEKAQQYMDWVTKEAARTPYSDIEMMTAATGIAPYAKDIETFKEYMKTAEVLAAINPAEGLEGATFALKEALSGDFVSLQERFNLPRNVINNLKEGKTTAEEFHQVVRKAAEAQGFTYDLVEKQSRTARGLWSTITGNLGTTMMKMGGGILEGLKPQLETIVNWMTTNGDQISKRATAIGQTIGNTIQTVSGWIRKYMPSIKAGIATVLDYLSPAFNTAKTTLGILWNAWQQAWPTISSILQTAWSIDGPVLNIIINTIRILGRVFQIVWPGIVAVVRTAWSILKPIFDAIATGIALIAKGVRWVAEKIGASPREVKVEKTGVGNLRAKGYATGLAYVPYDNFPALLHKGERVLTAAENRQYSRSRLPSTIIFEKLADQINASNPADVDRLLDKLEERLLQVAANMGTA